MFLVVMTWCCSVGSTKVAMAVVVSLPWYTGYSLRPIF